MEPRQHYSCAKKHRYRRKRVALQESKRVLAEWGYATRVYGPCRYCGGFHLTSKGV